MAKAFLVAVAVMALLAVLAGIGLMALTPAPATPSLNLTAGYDASSIHLYHSGGASLSNSSFLVLVDGVDETKNVTYSPPLQNGIFAPGSMMIIPATSPVQGVSLVTADSHRTIIQSVYAEDFVLTTAGAPWSMAFPTQSNAQVQGVQAPAHSYTWPASPTPSPGFDTVTPGMVTVAAANSADPSKAQFRCTGTDDQVVINRALATGASVQLMDGTFHCSGRIVIPTHTTLAGAGTFQTIIEVKNSTDGYQPIEVSAPYVTLRGFSTAAQGFIMISASHVRVQDVYATSLGTDGVRYRSAGNGMFFVWADHQDLSDIEFYNCTAYDCTTHGFNMNQDFTDRVPHAIQNTRFVFCYAALCGYGEAGNSRSEWTTGFDLQEMNDLVDCQVLNCIADNNWESGFHFEPGERVDDSGKEIGPATRTVGVVLQNCLSENNGYRNTNPAHYFMAGYYVHKNTVLTNCRAVHNRNAGYFVQSGSNLTFDRCQDEQSTYGWLVIKSSSGITLSNCTADHPRIWSLWASSTDDLTLNGFTQVSPGGARGTLAMLGWYRDEETYQKPVTHSTFEITTTGGGSLSPITKEGDGNRYTLTP
ncbi:right-handed parallel beta-helix repeat-containing protein [Methanosphaerula palustris]|nr:right-handed parallel beta-helix repeat-containing protein [Methanosphaerula palustris]